MILLDHAVTLLLLPPNLTRSKSPADPAAAAVTVASLLLPPSLRCVNNR